MMLHASDPLPINQIRKCTVLFVPCDYTLLPFLKQGSQSKLLQKYSKLIELVWQLLKRPGKLSKFSPLLTSEIVNMCSTSAS